MQTEKRAVTEVVAALIWAGLPADDKLLHRLAAVYGKH